ncbi:MAG: YaeQ family protein [Spirochaetales bacterium]
MAPRATVFKVKLNLSDMDRGYYADHDLTVAMHPSENEERLMLRLAVYCWHASESLSLANGLTDPDEPELWDKSLTGEIEHWIDLGQPDERTILRACGRARLVTLYHSRSNPALWWDGVAGKVAKARNLTVYNVDPAQVSALATLATKSMDLSVTLQDGEMWVRSDNGEALVTRDRLN